MSGFIPSTSAAGRALQQMLASRPDIRSLIGFAEEDVLNEVFRALEAGVIWCGALGHIARDHMSAADQSELAMQAFRRTGNFTAEERTPPVTAAETLPDRLRDVIRWIRAKDPLATNYLYISSAIHELEQRAEPRP